MRLNRSRPVDPATHVVALTALAALAAVAVTLTISLSDRLRFASFMPTGYVALETTAGLVCALAAFLALGRFRIHRAPADLALLAALAVLASMSLLFFTGPAVLDRPVGALAVWARALGTLLAAAAFAVAAFAAPGADDARLRRLIAGYGAASVGGLLLLLALRPEVGLPEELAETSLSRPLVAGSPILLALHLVAGAGFAAAAVGFARRCRQTGDRLMFALALAMPLAAGASFHYFLFPSPYANYVFSGDVYRLTFFAVILAGVLAQIGSYQVIGERLGVARERERLAREMHDGPVQELALLQLVIDQLDSRLDGPAKSMLDERAAAALQEWRHALAEVSRPGRGTVHEGLDATLRSVLAGTRARFELHADPDLVLERDAMQHLTGFVREAASNALRHGGASRIAVRVEARDGLHVQVSDDGTGTEVRSRYGGTGRGMQALCDRAAALGGDLVVESSRSGTTLKVTPAA